MTKESAQTLLRVLQGVQLSPMENGATEAMQALVKARDELLAVLNKKPRKSKVLTFPADRTKDGLVGADG